MHSGLHLTLVIIGNALQRIATGTSGVLVGLYLADLASRGSPVGAGLVGTLGAVSFGAELVGALPMGIASDAVAPRVLMTAGSLMGAVATQLFGMSGLVGIFFLSRTLEGLGASAVAPPLLAHLTDVTENKHGWKQFQLDCGGRIVSLALRPRMWNKLTEAAANWPLWVAAISGQMGQSAGQGFTLVEPSLQVFERKAPPPKEAPPEGAPPAPPAPTE